jgi:hypothetical protein
MIQVYLVISMDQETGDQVIEGCYASYNKANEAALGISNINPNVSVHPITVK